MARIIHYNSIKDEIRRIGLTQQKCADMLGVTLSGLNHRIKANKQQLHWSIYGLSRYMEGEPVIVYKKQNVE